MADTVKPFTNWWNAYTTVCKNKADKISLYKRTFDGEFGQDVKWSLFGLYDKFDDLAIRLIDKDTIKNMKFYSRLE